MALMTLRSSYGGSRPAVSGELHRRLNDAYTSATASYGGLDKGRLARAYNEAKQLASCTVFQDALMPEVSVDPNGEFIFTCSPRGGYFDIGVSGDQKLSFHVRNDLNKELSDHADLDWKGQRVPDRLITALESLQI